MLEFENLFLICLTDKLGRKNYIWNNSSHNFAKTESSEVQKLNVKGLVKGW